MYALTWFLVFRQPPNAQSRWRLHAVLLVLPRRTLQITHVLPPVGQRTISAVLPHQLRPFFIELSIALQGSRTRTRGDGPRHMRTFEADGRFGGCARFFITVVSLVGRRNDCVVLIRTGIAYRMTRKSYHHPFCCGGSLSLVSWQGPARWNPMRAGVL